MSPLLHPFDTLRVLSRSVTLAYPDESLAERLATLAREPIHAEGFMPFQNHWSHAPGDVRAERVREHLARSREEVTPDDWSLPMVVLNEHREVIGCQSLTARGFGLMGTLTTGSWLASRHQGRGYGTLMRRAALALAFSGLHAAKAHTVARADNTASLRVTEKIGYRKVAEGTHVYLGEEVPTVGYEMTRDQWPKSPGHLSPVLAGTYRARAYLGIELPSRTKDRDPLLVLSPKNPLVYATLPRRRKFANPDQGLDNPR